MSCPTVMALGNRAQLNSSSFFWTFLGVYFWILMALGLYYEQSPFGGDSYSGTS